MTTKGLEGVVAAETTISEVYGDEGRLIYRGYEIEDLAENATFEEVCYLLWYGELPNRTQLDTLRERLVTEAAVPDGAIGVLNLAPKNTHPMASLRTGVSALSFFDPDAEDNSPEANQRKAIRLTGQTITLTAAIDRVRNGQPVLAPRRHLSLAGNFLYMLTGNEPDDLSERIIDVALTLHAEHSMNASTFAGRIAAGTLSDMHSAVTAAIATLKGALHGGANEQVMKMLQKIAKPEDAESWVRAKLEHGEKIMGFGHRVYRTLDPRAPILKKLAEQLGALAGEKRWLDTSDRIVRTMREEMDRRGKKIYPNVDFFSASVYFTLGIPVDMFTNVFACARMAGWTAHVMEQHADNRLIRPDADYLGPTGKKVQPIDKRG